MIRSRRALAGSALLVGLFTACAVYVFYPPAGRHITFPDGKSFAFTIIDDTDGATLEKLRPVYDYLYEMGLRTTKTVWVLPSNAPDEWPNRGETLQDSAYRAFVLELQEKGFEIASHGARGGSSIRGEILAAMDEFESVVGHYPRIFVNHYENRDNVYFGADKFSFPPYRWLYPLVADGVDFEGQLEGSPFFWADFLQRHVRFVVNYSFHEVNLLDVNPSIPYHLPGKPYVNYWFHTADGGDIRQFRRLLSPANLDRLEHEDGVCIVYTHLARGFVEDGRLDATFRERIADLTSRNGWFPTAGELLDYLRVQPGYRDRLTPREKIRLETLWLIEKLRYGRS